MIDPKEAAILQPQLEKRCDRLYSIIRNRSESNMF